MVTVFCPGCGDAVAQSGRGRPKLWCSSECRVRTRAQTPEGRERQRQRDAKRGGTRRRPRLCEVCSAAYVPTYNGQRTCSRAHGIVLRRTVTGTLTNNGRRCDHCDIPVDSHSHVAFVNCAELRCGKLFVAGGRRRRVVCSARCARVRMNRKISAAITARYHSDPAFHAQVLAAAHLRRADKLGAIAGDIRDARDLIAYLMMRDRGRCGICRRPIRAAKGPRRPSVDHIIPLKPAFGERGRHELANLQAAHLDCNLSKNNRGGGEQLLLVG